ncbi:hypothetical protein ARSEF1564_005165 [Beauveria bassiana]
MRIAIIYITLIGLACAQTPPCKETPPGQQILDQAIAGIGALPELFKPKPGSSDWREDTLKGPRKKPGTVWPKNSSPDCWKRDLCVPGSGKLPIGGKIPSLGGTLANTYGGLAGAYAIGLGVQRLVEAIHGAPEKIQEIIDSITRFQEEYFGKGTPMVYPINPGKYGHCERVKRPDIHPNPEYRKELIRINCPPGTVVEEVEEAPDTPAEPPRQCFDTTGPIPCGGGQTEEQLDIGRAVCGSCGSFWDPEGGKCRDIKGALVWPSLTAITERVSTPSGQCSDSTGSFPCGGGQSEAELDMGWAVCSVCGGFAWDPEGGKCRQKDGKLLWPHQS